VAEQVDGHAAAGPADHPAAQGDGDGGEQAGLVERVRRVERHDPIADRVDGRIVAGQQRLVDAVLGDQLGGLGGERLRLGRRTRGVLGLGQELPHPGEQRVGGH
jgi:hypothetical protein